MIYKVKENCQCGAVFSYEEQVGNGINSKLDSRLQYRYSEFLAAHAVCRNKPIVSVDKHIKPVPLPSANLPRPIGDIDRVHYE